MALIECKECAGQVSDQADACPKCGWRPGEYCRRCGTRLDRAGGTVGKTLWGRGADRPHEACRSCDLCIPSCGGCAESEDYWEARKRDEERQQIIDREMQARAAHAERHVVIRALGFNQTGAVRVLCAHLNIGQTTAKSLLKVGKVVLAGDLRGAGTLIADLESVGIDARLEVV